MTRVVDVVVYFASDLTRFYQLAQWLPVLDALDERRPVAVVVRDAEVAAAAGGQTRLPVLLAPDLESLTSLYDELDASVALYCNNAPDNFSSLLYAPMLHVHVNHGESDKHSSASNNAKAYDRVFVAGEAAVQRHATTLLEFDLNRLVRVGRPQLDLRPASLLGPSSRRTVLYAPTWEGDADYNNYTSVDRSGAAIARAVLAVPDVRLVYKPHPKVTTSTTPAVAAGHQAVLAELATADEADPSAGHVAITGGDILALLPVCDAMITDVSSVGLDWLYLRTAAPLLLTDRHDDGDRLAAEVPVSRCSDVVDHRSLAGLTSLLASRLDHDELRPAREAMRRHYFDDLQIGESTTRFLAAVDELVALRASLRGL